MRQKLSKLKEITVLCYRRTESQQKFFRVYVHCGVRTFSTEIEDPLKVIKYLFE